MMPRLATVAAFAATASMVVTPLTAAEMPAVQAPAALAKAGFEADGVNADNYRRWHRRDRVDAGDVIGGLLVLGTIAAVASAASNANRNRARDYRYPYRSPYPGGSYDSRYRTQDDRGWSAGNERAVDMCAREVERNARIDTVDAAERNAAGWHVTGRLRTGQNFTCMIGNDGRIDGVEYGQGFDRQRGAVLDRQWQDDRYAAARQAEDGRAAVPAYPGGPLPGDPTGDGRYETADAPDFPG